MSNLPHWQSLGPDRVFEVADHLVGKSLIDGLRRHLTTGSQVEEGDHFMDHSHDLLQMHFQLMDLDDRNIVQKAYEKLVFDCLYGIADW